MMQLASPEMNMKPPRTGELMCFRCPCCHQRLNVPRELAGVTGPCPVCVAIIRAPGGPEARQMVAANQMVTTSEVSLSAQERDQWQQADPNRAGVEEASASGQTGEWEPGKFSAVLRIVPPAEAQLDDSWRGRYSRERQLLKRRRRRQQFLQKWLYSSAAQRYQRIGTALLAVFLAVTMVMLYLNRRSGGALLQPLFGR